MSCRASALLEAMLRRHSSSSVGGNSRFGPFLSCATGLVRDKAAGNNNSTLQHPEVCRGLSTQQIGRGGSCHPHVYTSAREVEVKIRLPDERAYMAVAEALAEGWRQDHNLQDCYFTDSSGRLEAALMALRCRLYDEPKRAVLALKGKPTMKGGIGRAYEIEEDVDPLLAGTFMAHPAALVELNSEVMETCRRDYGVVCLVSLGSFHNLRREFEWEGHVVELDRTTYDHGTLYEVEIETATPGAVRFRMGAFLRGLGISFRYSAATKFGNFMDNTLL